MDADARQDWHTGFLPSALTVDGKKRLVCSYTTVFQGFAAWLTDEEVEAMKMKPGFGRSFPNEDYELETTRTPEFLGIDDSGGYVWNRSSYGKGVIIGVLDSGVKSDHPSFDDHNMDPPPAKWKGGCYAGGSFRCNRKIIGTRSFLEGGENNVDDDGGHGTHVASTAAGNFVHDAFDWYSGQAAGTASGMAPAEHLAIYKVCNATRCPAYAISQGFDQALSDGVDIISASLGPRVLPSSPPNYQNPVTLGAFRAVAQGVLVVASAGNKGPDAGTVTNDAPWHLTVAAGSIDRDLSAGLVLGSGVIIRGQSSLQGTRTSDTEEYPLHCVTVGGLQGCASLKVEEVDRRFVVCDDAGVQDRDARIQIVQMLYNANAAYVVLVSEYKLGDTIPLLPYGKGTIQVRAVDGEKIKNYCQSPDAKVNNVWFRGTSVDVAGAPVVAYFSGRGPSKNNPNVLEPDILAPGLNVLAAGIKVPDQFVFKSGTSMATPHVSGVAALLKNLHPDWSPAAIRSAIMTTAERFNNVESIILDEQRNKATGLEAGAGQITPEVATNPGLVYDLNPADYAAFLCGVFGPQDQLEDVLGDLNLNCTTLPRMRDVNINYPSIVVPANTTVRRTITWLRGGPVEENEEEYTATVVLDAEDDEHSDVRPRVHVSPEQHLFSHPG
ncbi:hypothetical protein BS78_01G414200 [Paspalum vaginatum]|nr:hypothetical protein BS78_01G414200 [Paspalum vaginatum]